MQASGKGGRLCVHFSLLACLTLTGRWLVGWVFLQLGLDLAGLWLVEWVRLHAGLNLLTIWGWTFGDMDIQVQYMYAGVFLFFFG